MAPHTTPDTPARRLHIPAGASRLFALRPGATVICTEGSLRVEESATGPEAAGGLPGAVSVRVNMGEAHGVAYGGAVRLTAIGDARVICLDPPHALSRLFPQLAGFLRAIWAKNRNDGVGALHKISK